MHDTIAIVEHHNCVHFGKRACAIAVVQVPIAAEYTHIVRPIIIATMHACAIAIMHLARVRACTLAVGHACYVNARQLYYMHIVLLH